MKHLHWWNKHRPMPAVSDALRYFRKRLAHMAYPQFQAQGWPIGSGMVESANKVVMQARMKGAGMHWSPANVNPMLALRDEICNDRWAESWGQQQQWRKEHQHQHRQRQAQKRKEDALARLKQQILRVYLLMSPVKPAKPAEIAKGRTEGQKRWGRTTFSHKTLLSTAAKK
jgi:hypothetical protein